MLSKPLTRCDILENQIYGGNYFISSIIIEDTLEEFSLSNTYIKQYQIQDPKEQIKLLNIKEILIKYMNLQNIGTFIKKVVIKIQISKFISLKIR